MSTFYPHFIFNILFEAFAFGHGTDKTHLDSSLIYSCSSLASSSERRMHSYILRRKKIYIYIQILLRYTVATVL